VLFFSAFLTECLCFYNFSLPIMHRFVFLDSYVKTYFEEKMRPEDDGSVIVESDVSFFCINSLLSCLRIFRGPIINQYCDSI